MVLIRTEYLCCTVNIMKYFKFLTVLTALAVSTVFLSNCGDTESVSPDPVLEFIGGVGYLSEDADLSTAQTFVVGINASHTSDISTFKVTVSYNGGAALVPAGCTLCDTAINAKTLRVDYEGFTANQAGTEVWTFTVTDKEGNSTSKSITITVKAGLELYPYEVDNQTPPQPHKVWNFIGPNAGAYEIGSGPAYSSDPNSIKDIQDSINISDGTTWPGRWTSRNGGMFKKITSHSWESMLNTVQLEEAWTNGGTAVGVLLPQKGDYYVMKLSSGNYCFIEILDRVSTSGNNLDYISFRYKFRPL